ncbi:hypothetical protein NMY22_g18560 [Coprinellus aureogranulatus]|nr:hypothetical protein NMY22_g18560 [Coprinellus aureogranulatus]
MVPFYAKCLIENSAEGKLNTTQLRMAYAALVRSACACGGNSIQGSDEPQTYALGWYCVHLLLDTIHTIADTQKKSDKGKGKAREEPPQEDTSPERLHRLELTLVSTLSSLPLPLLAKALDEVLKLLTGEDAEVLGKEKREEVVKALFEEILEGVGDREKEYAMVWWYKHREALGGEVERGERAGRGEGEGEGEDGEEKVVARL